MLSISLSHKTPLPPEQRGVIRGRSLYLSASKQPDYYILSFEYVKRPDGTGKGKSPARGGSGSEHTRGKFRRLRMDLCIFVYEDSDGNVMYLVHYVDDIILASTSVRIRDAFIVHLNEAWNVTLEGKMERLLGIHL